MKLTWLGHSGFRLESGDATILIDPWLTGNPMMPEDRHDEAVAGATHVLLTHHHFDHNADVVRLSKKLSIPALGQFDMMSYWGEKEGIETVGFNKGGTVEMNGVTATMVNAEHSSTIGSKTGPLAAGSECGYIIRAEGKTIYLTGDTDVMADMDWIGDYYKPEIGIFCAGGFFTMDMRAAAYAAKRYFRLKTLIPCHYRTFPVLAQSAQELIDALPEVNVIEPQVLEPIEL